MTEIIIGICALLLGGVCGFFVGYGYMLKGMLKLIGIKNEDLNYLKNDLHDIVKQMKNTRPLNEETKEHFRKIVFNTFMKYSKFKHNDTVCVTIAHED